MYMGTITITHTRSLFHTHTNTNMNTSKKKSHVHSGSRSFVIFRFVENEPFVTFFTAIKRDCVKFNIF